MTPLPTPKPRLARRWLPFAASWGWRSLIIVALANLAWSLADWHDRRSATGERQFFRGAERPDAIDYGLVDLRIVNETGRDWVVNQVSVDDWGGQTVGRPGGSPILTAAGSTTSTLVERRNVDHLVADARIALTDRATGELREVRFVVDRRRPTSCSVEVRIAATAASVSACILLREMRTEFRWPPGQTSH